MVEHFLDQLVAQLVVQVLEVTQLRLLAETGDELVHRLTGFLAHLAERIALEGDVQVFALLFFLSFFILSLFQFWRRVPRLAPSYWTILVKQILNQGMNLKKKDIILFAPNRPETRRRL